MTRLFLWDIDGTLIGTAGAGMRALDRAIADVLGIVGGCRGIAADGKTDPIIVDEIFGARLGRAARAEEHDAVIERYLAHLEDEVARTDRYQIYPGVIEALDLMEARGATLGLATGNVARGAEIKLRRGDLWRRFPFGGFGSDAAERGLLVARAIERAAAHARRAFAREEVWVIGDTPRDVAAAHVCGVRAIAVATGPHQADTLRAAGADVVFATMAELPGWWAQ